MDVSRIDGLERYVLGFEGGRDDWSWVDKKPRFGVVGFKLPWQIGGLCIKVERGLPQEWGQQRPVGRNLQDGLEILDNAG